MNGHVKCRFEVEDIFPYKDGFGLGGRCTAGTIKIGDVFAFVLNEKKEYIEGRSDWMRRQLVGKVSLVVSEIQYFNKSILELQTNHAGGLYVVGQGAELLLPHCEIESA